ncbi:hypothetical protein SDC9_104340 [bioreactor metagenome]|uniref:Tape measure protein N-terminal domain-containing protein n=1 Tax=bioreactor metagenome TaxID=1076179 RepID=A0A645AXM6_9ZZZZ
MEGMGGGSGGGGGMLMKGGGWIAAGAAIGYGAFEFAKSSEQLAMQNEQNAVSFEVLLGSAGKADTMLRNIADFAARTPFRKLEVTDAAQSLLGYGVNADKVIPVINQLGDVSRGNAEVFKRVVENYGKAVSAQRMRTEDINQFAEAGIPMWAELEKITGKSGQALRKYVETNGISVDQMNAAFASMTGSGGKFHGMMQKQSQTTAGRISTLADNFDELKLAAGDRMKPTMDKMVDAGSQNVKLAKDWMAVPAEQKLMEQKAQMNALVHTVTDYNLTEDQRMQTLETLQTKYPEYFANIDLEKVKNEDLLNILGKVNDEYDRKIKVVSSQSVLDDLKAKEQALNDDIVRRSKIDYYMKMYNETGDASYKKLAQDQETMWETASRWGQNFVKYTSFTGLFVNKSESGTNTETDKLQKELQETQQKEIDAAWENNFRKANVNYELVNDIGRKYISNASGTLEQYFKGSRTEADKFLASYSAIKTKMFSGKLSDSESIFAELQALADSVGASTPGATGGLSNTGASGLGSGITDVSGDRVAQKNVTINITNLIEGGFTISSTNMQEGAGQAKDIVVQALLDAVNDANHVAQ